MKFLLHVDRLHYGPQEIADYRLFEKAQKVKLKDLNSKFKIQSSRFKISGVIIYLCLDRIGNMEGRYSCKLPALFSELGRDKEGAKFKAER